MQARWPRRHDRIAIERGGRQLEEIDQHQSVEHVAKVREEKKEEGRMSSTPFFLLPFSVFSSVFCSFSSSFSCPQRPIRAVWIARTRSSGTFGGTSAIERCERALALEDDRDPEPTTMAHGLL
jgi:hypothetical protein